MMTANIVIITKGVRVTMTDILTLKPQSQRANWTDNQRRKKSTVKSVTRERERESQ